MISREDIRVESIVEPKGIRISVKIRGIEYSSWFSGDGAAMHAIDNLVDNLMRKEIGVTKHDFIMRLNDYFISNRKSEERKDSETGSETEDRTSTYGGL